MYLHEYNAKKMLRECGIQTPQGIVAKTEHDAETAIDTLKFPLYLKAQVLAGGRGKMGAVKKANTRAEAIAAFKEIRKMIVKTIQTGPQGLPVDAVLIEEGQVISSEYFAAISVDRAASCPVLMVSTCGGMDIETAAREKPESIIRIELDIVRGIADHQARRIHFALGNSTVNPRTTQRFLNGLFKTFVDNDATLVEINPLASTFSGELIALDGKIVLDDNAFPRHSDWAEYDKQNKRDQLEIAASKFDLNYVKVAGGSIGCMVNGAGLAMATMDAVKLYGGEAANFLDVGGNVDVEAATAALRILTSDPDVKVILVNVFGGIVRCDIIAAGLLAASKEVHVKVPLVVRLDGTEAIRGLDLLKENGGSFELARDLKQAVLKAVLLSKGNYVNTY